MKVLLYTMCCGDWEKALPQVPHCCARTQAATLTWLLLWLYIKVCCEYVNLVEIAICVQSCTAMWKTLSLWITAIHLCTPTWTRTYPESIRTYTEPQVRRSRRTGNGRSCHDYEHRLTGRRMYSTIASTVLWAVHAVHAVMRNPVLLLLLLLHCCSTAISTCKHYVFTIAKPLSFYIE